MRKIAVRLATLGVATLTLLLSPAGTIVAGGFGRR